ncbi:MAG: hypothetical protein CL534_25015 [Ahrensia sp.]|nr:hypothetical protein [Ahrensia sp.]
MNFVAQMKRSGLETATECSLLFEDLPQLDASEFAGRLEQAIGTNAAVADIEDQAAGTAHYISLTAGGCRIAVEVSKNTRPPPVYFEALDWPMLHRNFPEAEEIVRGHHALIHISVEAEYDAVANALGMRPVNTTFTRNLLAARAAAAVSRIAMPSAIHWKGCEMLYKPGPFLRELDTEPVELFVKVTPFSSNRQIGGVRAVGGSTRGAYELLGREVVMEEAPVPVDWVIRALHAFVTRCQANGGLLPHLATFAPGRGDILIVRHLESTPEIQEPHISLEVRRADEVGFDATHVDDIALATVTKPKWDGAERRARPKSAKPFGRRGLA